MANKRIILANVYFPTRDKENAQCDMLADLNEKISSLFSEGYTIIIGGDFNVVMNRELDYMGSSNVSKRKFRDSLQDFIDNKDLIDIWRTLHPNKKEFTFKQKTPLVQSRLDYIFVSSKFKNLVKHSEIIPSITPDHAGVKIEFSSDCDSFSFGKSYWKFNSSLCNEKDFQDGIKIKISEIEETWKDQISNRVQFWEFMKMKLREYIMKFSREKAKVRKLQVEKLEREIKELEDQLVINFQNTTQDQIDLKKIELENLFDYSRQGLKVRSRVEWSEEGERKSQFFEQLLKSNKRKSVIKELYDDNGLVLCDERSILKVIKKFYGNLYECRQNEIDTDVEDMFLNDIPKLSEENKNSCEGKITIEECYQALKGMKWNKSPGNDGFTAEFYFTFWPMLGKYIVEAFNESYDMGMLSSSQRQGIITLIEKDGKDPLYMKNYRPITLLNVDYKILSKVLAKRVKEVLVDIIHYDQVGYVQNRKIGEAVRLIDDILYKSLFQSIGILVAVDFEKAFDSISHRLLLRALESFGFGKDFRSWVSILYNDVSSCVMNGGHSTGYFQVQRGVRQGDPLSAYLFTIAIELLAHYIRKDVTVEGVSIGTRVIKQVLYADDMTLFLKNIDSLYRIKTIFNNFEKLSGLKINIEKTNFMWLGEEEVRSDLNMFGNRVEYIRILGVYFSRNPRIKDDMNYKEILSKIKRLISWWKQRDLTIYGKIKLLKTYVLSKLNYVASILTVPHGVFKEIEQISFNFIWGGNDRIKRKILYQDYCDGGLRVMNFELFVRTQRIMWIKRLLYGEKDMSWKIMVDYFFRSFGGRSIFLCNYDINRMDLNGIPTFYKDMLEIWQGMNECRHFERDKINPIIFNNKSIYIRNRMFFDNDLIQKGIFEASDIIEGGELRPISYFYNLGFTTLNLLTIQKIYSSISNEWIQGNFMSVDRENYDIDLKISGHVYNFRDLKSFKLYNYFIAQLQSEYTLKITDGHHQYDFRIEELKELFICLKNAVICNTQRGFQYKLLFGAVYTKEKLCQFGFETDYFCSFCTKEIETYEHLFLYCPKVKQLWQEIIRKLDFKEINLSNWKSIFMGIQSKTVRANLINCVIFLVKHIIFNSKKQGDLPSIGKIMKMVKNYRDEEHKIAINKGKLGAHLIKWEQINSIL